MKGTLDLVYKGLDSNPIVRAITQMGLSPQEKKLQRLMVANRLFLQDCLRHEAPITWDEYMCPENHPLASGTIVPSSSLGLSHYRILGPLCRLYDREELPWPCCNLGWKGKQPSWRRVGKRFIPDIANKGIPSYSANLLLENGLWSEETTILTPYPLRKVFIPKGFQGNWWFDRRPNPDVRYKDQDVTMSQ